MKMRFKAHYIEVCIDAKTPFANLSMHDSVYPGAAEIHNGALSTMCVHHEIAMCNVAVVVRVFT